MVAAFFAVEEEYNTDAVIYKYQYKFIVSLDNSDPFTYKRVAILKPYASSERILRQKANFTIHPDPKVEFATPSIGEVLEKLIIKKSYKPKLRAELRTYGITQFEIYGDIDGLSKYINWRSKFFDIK